MKKRNPNLDRRRSTDDRVTKARITLQEEGIAIFLFGQHDMDELEASFTDDEWDQFVADVFNMMYDEKLASQLGRLGDRIMRSWLKEHRAEKRTAG